MPQYDYRQFDLCVQNHLWVQCGYGHFTSFIYYYYLLLLYLNSVIQWCILERYWKFQQQLFLQKDWILFKGYKSARMKYHLFVILELVQIWVCQIRARREVWKGVHASLSESPRSGETLIVHTTATLTTNNTPIRMEMQGQSRAHSFTVSCLLCMPSFQCNMPQCPWADTVRLSVGCTYAFWYLGHTQPYTTYQLMRKSQRHTYHISIDLYMFILMMSEKLL